MYLAQEYRYYLNLTQSFHNQSNIPIINGAWHISREIHEYVRVDLKLNNKIIDLVETDDFA